MAIVENSAEFIEIVQAFLEGDRLAASRVINDVAAVGYQRDYDEGTIVLWVNPSDGRPLLVEQESAGGVSTRSVLSFNIPLPANAFEIE